MCYATTTARRLGVDILKPGVRVMDFGCGDGHVVHELVADGVDAYGVDIDRAALAVAGDRCRFSGDRLPFPDEHFDFVYANQVLEHVADFPGAMAEVARVLKPGGSFYTASPARWGPLEPHISVPFVHWMSKTGGARLSWLRICRRLGIGRFHGASAEEQVAYLRDHTFYRSRAAMQATLSQHFGVRFVAARQVTAAMRDRGLRLPRALAPLIEWAVGTFHEHRLLLVKR